MHISNSTIEGKASLVASTDLLIYIQNQLYRNQQTNQSILSQYNIRSMKPCPKCLQFHDNLSIVTPNHHCLTYQKFTDLLKDRFYKKKREQIRRSNNTTKQQKQRTIFPLYPKNNPHSQQLTPSELKNNLNTVRKSTNTPFLKSPPFDSASQDIDKIISKCRTCRKRHLNCYHHNSTLADQTMDKYSKQDNEELEESLEESQTSLTTIRIFEPVQTPFKKPYNSRLITENPVVYDSLLDNRLCGCTLIDQDETEVKGKHYQQLLTKISSLK